MLHINIVGVVTNSDNSTRRLVTCIIGSFFSIHFIITLHSSIAATSASQYKKKTKIEQNAINSCHVLQFHVRHFLVLHFHVRHFQPTPYSCNVAFSESCHILSQYDSIINIQTAEMVPVLVIAAAERARRRPIAIAVVRHVIVGARDVRVGRDHAAAEVDGRQVVVDRTEVGELDIRLRDAFATARKVR